MQLIRSILMWLLVGGVMTLVVAYAGLLLAGASDALFGTGLLPDRQVSGHIGSVQVAIFAAAMVVGQYQGIRAARRTWRRPRQNKTRLTVIGTKDH